MGAPRMIRCMHHRPGMIVCCVVVLLLLCTKIVRAAWTGKRSVESPLTQGRCYLASEAVPVNDGYQDIRATVVVQRDAVLVHTESPLDESFADIGLQVDNNNVLKMDHVVQRTTAAFTSHYADIIEQFKKGNKVRVQLRFWPTWPVTGTHAITVSLLGFSKAFADMQACKE